MSLVRFHGYSLYTCSYYRSLFLVCHQLGSMAIECIHVFTIGLCSYYVIIWFHGCSMCTCSYYKSLLLVCHQLGSMAIVCIHVVTIGLCS